MEQETKKATKIEAAIYDTESRLKNVCTEIMLLNQKRETLQEQFDALNIINKNKFYDQ